MYEGKMFGKIVDAAYGLYSGKWLMMPIPPDTLLAFLSSIAGQIPRYSISSVKFEDLLKKFSVEGVYEGRIEYGNGAEPYTIKHTCISYASSSIPEMLNKYMKRKDLKSIEFEAEMKNFFMQDPAFLKDFDEWWCRHEARIQLNAEYGGSMNLMVELLFHAFGSKGGVYFDSLTFEKFSDGNPVEREAVSFPGMDEYAKTEEERLPRILSMELARFTHQISGNTQEPIKIERGGKAVNITKLAEECLSKVPALVIEKDLESFGSEIKKYAARNMLEDLRKLYLIGIDGGMLRSYQKFIVKNGFSRPIS